MRNAFADELTELAKVDERILLLSGDIGNKLFDAFKEIARERFFNCGIAEANMMGVAAGFALSGFRPIIYTITPFTTTRCFEQIRVDVCYHEAPVIIVGTGSGLSYTELGPTHHSLEDIAILRTLPGMRIMAPGDATELRLVLRAALQQNNPVYIRIGKKGEPDFPMYRRHLEIGKVSVLKTGVDIVLLSSGTLIAEVLTASVLLHNEGINAEIVSVHTIKPLDEAYLASAAQRFKLLVTIEEHGLIGGLGSAVAEWRARENNPVAQLSMGTPDQFMHDIGSQAYARKKYGLDAEGIRANIVAVLGRHC